MYQANEVVRLLLIVFLAPMVVTGIRQVTVVGKPWFVGSYLAMVCGYVFTVAEGYASAVTFNLLEHSAYAVSGLFLAVAMFLFERDAERQVR